MEIQHKPAGLLFLSGHPSSVSQSTSCLPSSRLHPAPIISWEGLATQRKYRVLAIEPALVSGLQAGLRWVLQGPEARIAILAHAACRRCAQRGLSIAVVLHQIGVGKDVYL